jgi:hypothetical protein
VLARRGVEQSIRAKIPSHWFKFQVTGLVSVIKVSFFYQIVWIWFSRGLSSQAGTLSCHILLIIVI